MFPGLDAHRHPAARAAPAQRQTRPCRSLSSCHPFPAPQAHGAAQSGLSRSTLPPPSLRHGVRRLARRSRRATSLPHHGRILALAFDRSCEAELALALQAALDDDVLPDLAALIERFRPKDAPLPVVVVRLPSLAIYDQIATSAGEAA